MILKFGGYSMWKTGRILPMLHGWRRIGRMEDPKILTTSKVHLIITTEHIDYEVISHLLSRKYSSIQSNYIRPVAVDMGQSRGSMKLLAESEEYFDSPNWDNLSGFETPFGAMAELLNSWPVQALRKPLNRARMNAIFV